MPQRIFNGSVEQESGVKAHQKRDVHCCPGDDMNMGVRALRNGDSREYGIRFLIGIVVMRSKEIVFPGDL